MLVLSFCSYFTYISIKSIFYFYKAWKGCYSTSFMYESGLISDSKYEKLYESESMTLDYCGQMCEGVDDTIFMGVSITKCYCLNDITGSLLLSNRACGTKCPGKFFVVIS